MARVKREAETPFLRRVIEYARLKGWLVRHCRSVWTRSGYKTPLKGDPGFPDLVLTRLSRVIFAELKDTYARPDPNQRLWLAVLQVTGKVEVFLWRPQDEETIWSLLA